MSLLRAVFPAVVPAAFPAVVPRVAAALCAVALPLGAQSLRPSATGATLALSGRAALVSSNLAGPREWSGAGGLAGEVGYGVSPRLTLFAAMATLRLSSSTSQRFADGDVGFRRLFGRGGNALRPFLEGGISVQRMTVRVGQGASATEARSTTGSVTGGGGAMLFLTRRLSVEGALRATGGRFTTWTDAAGVSRPVLPVQVRSVALRAGARYWLAGR